MLLNPEKPPEDVVVHHDDGSITINDYRVVHPEGTYDAHELMTYAASRNLSDIHMSVGDVPFLRVNGELQRIKGLPEMKKVDIDEIREVTMDDKDYGMYINQMYSKTYAYSIPKVGRFRMIITRTDGGSESIVARKLLETPPTFDQLNTHASIRELATLPDGMIFVCGITGSGKSTLLSAMVDNINATQGKKILSVEDPIEIIHANKKSLVEQRGIGVDTLSYHNAIVDALRQDPDILIIGEIRTLEEAQAALSFAESGHLVISTLHATNAVTAINRFIDIFKQSGETDSARNRFAEVVRGIIAQKLVRTVSESGALTAVNEIMLNIPEIQRGIEDKIPSSEMQELFESSTGYGMRTFEDHFIELIKEEVITPEVAIYQAPNRGRMKKRLKKEGMQHEIDVKTTEKKKFSEIVADTNERFGKVDQPIGGSAPRFNLQRPTAPPKR